VFEANEISAEQINTMSTLLNDLLDISRISRGKIQLRKEKIPLNSIIKKAMNSVLPNIVAKNHILKEELAGENIVLYADPVRIEQIIVNLLNNAAKYTDPKGKIVIKTSFDNNFAIISIRDTGIGIPNNQLDEIFEPFVQLSTAQKKSQGGLGIGLMLSKQLAELHGGDIKAKSNGMNKGSEFIVQIPADLKHRNHSRIRQENKNEGKTTKKVLLVDDNTRIAELFSKLLSQFGYLTKTAFEGESAIKISKSFNPDIILLDIGLPGIDGHETARLLRKQHRNNPSLKIIAISGYGTSEDKKKSKEAGCDAHITKPVNANKLREIIEAI
jgi:CheY-like chemotaxis protein